MRILGRMIERPQALQAFPLVRLITTPAGSAGGASIERSKVGNLCRHIIRLVQQGIAPVNINGLHAHVMRDDEIVERVFYYADFIRV